MKEKPVVHLGSRREVDAFNILLLKADNNYTEIYFDDGSRFLSSTTLGTLEQRLQPYNFFRVNRSTVINLNYLNHFKVHRHKTKSESSPCQNVKDIFLSRRRVAAFEACVNA